MALRVTLAKLRGIKLPPVRENEPDHVTALRNTLAFHSDSSESLRVCVPPAIADMLDAVETVETKPVETPTLKGKK